MKIATYNVNGINSRLPVLLRWLKESAFKKLINLTYETMQKIEHQEKQNESKAMIETELGKTK